MNDNEYRGAAFGRALDVLEFVQSRQTPFTKLDLAEFMGCSHRSALRYLDVLEGRGIVKATAPRKQGRIKRFVGPGQIGECGR